MEKHQERELVNIIWEEMKGVVKNEISNVSHEKADGLPFPKLLFKHSNDRILQRVEEAIKKMPIYPFISFDRTLRTKGTLQVLLNPEKGSLYLFTNQDVIRNNVRSLLVAPGAITPSANGNGKQEVTVQTNIVTTVPNPPVDLKKLEQDFKDLVTRCGGKRGNTAAEGHYHTFKRVESNDSVVRMAFYNHSIKQADNVYAFLRAIDCEPEIQAVTTVIKTVLDPTVDYSTKYSDELKKFFPPINAVKENSEKSVAKNKKNLPPNIVALEMMYNLLSPDDKELFLATIGIDKAAMEAKVKDARTNLLDTLKKLFSKDGKYMIVAKDSKIEFGKNGITIPPVDFAKEVLGEDK